MRFWRGTAAAAAIALALQPLAVLGAGASYVNTTPVTLTGSGITVQIVAGSTVQSMTANSNTIVLNVATGDSATLRYPGPTPGRLPNDGGLPDCNYVGGNNDAVINGPLTVTFTPNTTPCAASSGGGGGTTPLGVTLTQPNGGETLAAGSQYWIFWSTSGTENHTVTLDYSADGGLHYDSTIASGLVDDGAHQWTLPSTNVPNARVRVTLVASGGVVRAMDVSNADFSIVGTAPSPSPSPTPPPPPPPPTQPFAPITTYVPAVATASSPTISGDKDLPAVQNPNCVAHSLIKLPSDNDPATQVDSAVYYCGLNGRRYVFPNPGTFKSWYANFANITIVDAATLASIPLGDNVTYRPGVKMIKVQTDPKVYAVDKDGTLHWVPTESAAAALYGPFWNQMIDDVSDAFFTDYTVGAPIAG